MNDTFVYIHRKPCGEVFYVGIGCEQRPYSNSDRNKFWHNIVAKYGYEVEIIDEGLSWAEACELEKMLIAHYGRRDLGTGTLVNLTDGGEGSLGLIHSVETRQKLSAAKMGENNPNYGKKLSEETRQKLSAALSGENHPLYGKKRSEETRQKIGAANSGKKRSIVVCPHCNKEGGKNPMLRWHFDNCKHKKRVPN